MSISFNSPINHTMSKEPGTVAGDPGVKFNKMTDEQKRDFLTTDLERLKNKPEPTDNEKTMLSLIPKFLDGTIDSSDLGKLNDFYSKTSQNNNSTNTKAPELTPPDGQTPKI